MYLTDLHVHSSFSDGKLSIPELVDFYGQRKFGAIAITDHLCESSTFLGKAAKYLDRTLDKNEFQKYLSVLSEEKERAWDQYRMVLIPGVEITKNSWFNHRSAHILALGITDWLNPDDDIFAILKAIADQGAKSVAAHPVSTRHLEPQTYHLWDRRAELAPLFDAWEVASGPHWFDEVAVTKLPKLATSDLHHPRQINSWKSVFHGEKRQDKILEDLKSQNIDFFKYQEATSRSSFTNRNSLKFIFE